MSPGLSMVKTITVIVNGVEHHGTYYIQGSTVIVQSEKGNKATLFGKLPPENVAKLLLSELLRS